MKLQKKVKIALVFLIVCLVLVVSVSYAWFALAVNPEVTSIDTNVGANGSLEIALLSDRTYADPLLIRTMIGDSAVEKDALESNQSWGNVIELADSRYGLEKISLLPARLNVTADESGGCIVSSNMLQVAEFGADGRITILSEETVSAPMEGNSFTYYVDSQRYGVRAIGTISNLTSQQIALASSRTAVKSYTAAASRTVKHTWRDQGPAIMDILYSHYALGTEEFTQQQVSDIRMLAEGMLEALNYVDSALRQGMIGFAASQISDEPNFETLQSAISDTSLPLTGMVEKLGSEVPADFKSWASEVDSMKVEVQAVVAVCVSLLDGGTWEQIEPQLDVLLDAEAAYLNDHLLSSREAFESLTTDNVILAPPESGVMAKLAAFAGNYSGFSKWKNNISVELRSADPNETAYLIQVEKLLQNCKAATGGWTRSNLDDTYGFAVDLAFRSNVSSSLLLQTAGTLRVEESVEFPVTQGGGSYMRFTSDNMELERQLQLMDTIRIGFLSHRGELLAVAKLNVSNYEVQDEGVFAPLYLYEYSLTEKGTIVIGQRRSDDASIVTLPQNSPAVVTVVVWLDGDSVENSMVATNSHQSMDGVLNLQFASSADLLPTQSAMEEKK